MCFCETNPPVRYLIYNELHRWSFWGDSIFGCRQEVRTRQRVPTGEEMESGVFLRGDSFRILAMRLTG